MVALYIDGINLTKYLALPCKFGEVLDENLDTGSISLRHIRKWRFKPLTPVEIRIFGKEYYGKKENAYRTKTDTRYYLISTDTSTETPVGSGMYNHEIELVEVTKYAECIVCDTLTFTNDIGRNYTANAKKVTPDVDEG